MTACKDQLQTGTQAPNKSGEMWDIGNSARCARGWQKTCSGGARDDKEQICHLLPLLQPLSTYLGNLCVDIDLC